MLTQRARPFLFSTSHPPAVAAACLAAIQVLRDEPELIDRLWANTTYFKGELRRLGFDTGASETPITPVMMGDSAMAGRFSQRLFEEGVFAQAVVDRTARPLPGSLLEGGPGAGLDRRLTSTRGCAARSSDNR
jgi:glycine C-acetyltransferase